jgi:hypothetical protein
MDDVAIDCEEDALLAIGLAVVLVTARPPQL